MDAGARKVIEHVTRLEGHLNAQDVDLEAIKNDLKNRVTYKWLLSVAGVFALALFGVVESNRREREAALLQVRQEVAASRQEQVATGQRVEAKVDGLIKYFIEGKSKAEVRAEIRAEERATEFPAKPTNPLAPNGGGR